MYTQIALVKNPDEVIKDCGIAVSNGIISNYTTRKYSPLGESTYVNTKYQRPIILVPGFINLHSHLAYTASKPGYLDMFDWLYDLVDEQFSISDEILLEQHRSNARAVVASGTTFVVDNTRTPLISSRAMSEIGLKGIIGIEVFGSDAERAEEIFATKLREIAECVREVGSEKLEFCFSPHATYNVSVELMRLLLDWTRRIQSGSGIAPLLLSHAAESKTEENWFKDKDSAQSAHRLWNKMGTLPAKLKHWKSYVSSVQMLAANGLLDEQLLLTHLCCASDEDLVRLNDARVKLVTCPRSNEWLNNPKARTEKWAELGLEFGVGTDSLASNYDLDLRNEVNKLGLSAAAKLDLITRKAASILNKNLGTLEIGKAADYTVFEVHGDIDLDSCDPLELIFNTEATKVAEVYINGKCVHSNLARIES